MLETSQTDTYIPAFYLYMTETPPCLALLTSEVIGEPPRPKRFATSRRHRWSEDTNQWRFILTSRIRMLPRGWPRPSTYAKHLKNINTTMHFIYMTETLSFLVLVTSEMPGSNITNNARMMDWDAER